MRTSGTRLKLEELRRARSSPFHSLLDKMVIRELPNLAKFGIMIKTLLDQMKRKLAQGAVRDVYFCNYVVFVYYWE